MYPLKAYFTDKMNPYSINPIGDKVEVTFYEPAGEAETHVEDDGTETTIYPYELSFLEMYGEKKDLIEKRIKANLDAFTRAAKRETRKRELMKDTVPLSIENLGEMLLDQEYRLAMLELGVTL